ncbi:ion channel [uncultured Ruegeria sp.]|uniref:ion channel n=1 Tax=uncultured Ruegeria sp. TaxID=259304 RepID=UPI00345BCF71
MGLSIGRIKGWSTGTSLYHAPINATTVGYGDTKPEKPASRFLLSYQRVYWAQLCWNCRRHRCPFGRSRDDRQFLNNGNSSFKPGSISGDGDRPF